MVDHPQSWSKIKQWMLLWFCLVQHAGFIQSYTLILLAMEDTSSAQYLQLLMVLYFVWWPWRKNKKLWFFSTQFVCVCFFPVLIDSNPVRLDISSSPILSFSWGRICTMFVIFSRDFCCQLMADFQWQYQHFTVRELTSGHWCLSLLIADFLPFETSQPAPAL